jgi:iron complex outermembrane receptor protein
MNAYDSIPPFKHRFIRGGPMRLLQLARATVTSWLLFATLSVGVLAQSQATVHGTITDDSGAILPGVSVTARSLVTDVSRTSVSDTRGYYELSLEAGGYEIQAVLPGFRSQAAPTTVREGDRTLLDLTLSIAPLAETVTVTRTEQNLSEIPLAVTVVLGEDIQLAQRKVILSEALAGIPGLFAESRNNFSASGGVRLTVRAPQAAGLRGLQILQDGVPLTMADGSTQPGSIDLGSAGRMEVIRGPSSVLYGNSAGGVITLRTEFPSAARLRIQPDIQFGSFGYQRQQLKADGSAGSIGYLLNVSRMKMDGFRDNSQAEIRKANVALRSARSANTEIRAVFNYYDQPWAENPSSLTLADARDRPSTVRQQAIDQGWGEEAGQGQGGVTVEHQFGGGQVFRATGWGMWRDSWGPIPNRIIDLGRTAAGFRSEYGGRGTIGSASFQWTTGLDVSYQRDNRNEFVNAGVPPAGGRTREGALLIDQLETVRSVAPFAQVSIPFGTRWRLTTGARYDYYDFSATDHLLTDGNQSGGRNLSAASPMVGLTYRATDWLSAYTNYATAYRTPSTVELSNRPTGEGGFNEDLEPADLRTFEIGARGLVEKLRLQYEVVRYLSGFKKAFVPFQRPDEQVFYRNTGESTRNGTEIMLDWTPLARLRARLAYTNQDFTFKRFVAGGIDFSGKVEPGAAPQQFFVGGAYAAPFGLHSALQFRWVDRYSVNNAGTLFNPAYRVVDLRFGVDRKWGTSDIRPFFGIDNLLDQRYNGSTSPNAAADRAFEPSPGRSFYVGLTIGARLL